MSDCAVKSDSFDENEDDTEIASGDSENEDSESSSSEDTVDGEEEPPDSSSEVQTSEVCPICLNKFFGQDLGAPENCSHIFCLECVLEWSKNVNTCPIDREKFNYILVKISSDGEVLRKIKVKVKPKGPSEETIPEDTTACEICHLGDREDRLLLCDACDLAYHCECLTPPLRNIPIEEWFCSSCASILNKKPSTSTGSRTQRIIARTLVSEAVRSRIQQLRTETNEEPSFRITSRAQASAPRRKRKFIRRRKRRTVKRKRPLARTKKTAAAFGKSKSAGKVVTKKRRRRRYKRRKCKRLRKRTKRSRLASRPLAAPVSVKQRIADRLGLCKPPPGHSMPYVKPGSVASVSVEGTTLHSIFGNQYQLMDFEEDFMECSSGASSTSGMSTNPASNPSDSSVDVLSSIMAGQQLLHKSSRDLTIGQDGTLKLKEPSQKLSKHNASIISETRKPAVKFNDLKNVKCESTSLPDTSKQKLTENEIRRSDKSVFTSKLKTEKQEIKRIQPKEDNASLNNSYHLKKSVSTKSKHKSYSVTEHSDKKLCVFKIPISENNTVCRNSDTNTSGSHNKFISDPRSNISTKEEKPTNIKPEFSFTEISSTDELVIENAESSVVEEKMTLMKTEISSCVRNNLNDFPVTDDILSDSDDKKALIKMEPFTLNQASDPLGHATRSNSPAAGSKKENNIVIKSEPRSSDQDLLIDFPTNQDILTVSSEEALFSNESTSFFSNEQQHDLTSANISIPTAVDEIVNVLKDQASEQVGDATRSPSPAADRKQVNIIVIKSEPRSPDRDLLSNFPTNQNILSTSSEEVSFSNESRSIFSNDYDLTSANISIPMAVNETVNAAKSEPYFKNNLVNIANVIKIEGTNLLTVTTENKSVKRKHCPKKTFEIEKSVTECHSPANEKKIVIKKECISPPQEDCSNACILPNIDQFNLNQVQNERMDNASPLCTKVTVIKFEPHSTQSSLLEPTTVNITSSAIIEPNSEIHNDPFSLMNNEHSTIKGLNDKKEKNTCCIKNKKLSLCKKESINKWIPVAKKSDVLIKNITHAVKSIKNENIEMDKKFLVDSKCCSSTSFFEVKKCNLNVFNGKKRKFDDDDDGSSKEKKKKLTDSQGYLNRQTEDFKTDVTHTDIKPEKNDANENFLKNSSFKEEKLSAINTSNKILKLEHKPAKDEFNENKAKSVIVQYLHVKEKPPKTETGKLKQSNGSILENVENEVKKTLKPFYVSKFLTKENYKEIMRKCVPKVLNNCNGVLQPDKIKKLVDKYISIYMFEDETSCKNGKKS